MISYLSALDLLESHAKIQAVEPCQTLESLHRVVAEDIFSSISLPSFDNSAMDGFAIRAVDTLLASPNNVIELKVDEIIQAKAAKQHSAPMETMICCEIMTGAPIPIGYDSVIPIENVQLCDKNGIKFILINKPVELHQNVRFIGEDVKQGSLLLKQGQQIQANDVMLLLSLGIAQINVFAKISLAIATTGEEISDDYSRDLQFGEIYNSNAPLLINLAHENCFSARYAGILRDNQSTLLEFIQTSPEQVLITTGAVSKGKWDFIPDTLRELGADIIFHSVAIRPGKPVLFARLRDGRYFFGLPGNPVSSMVGWRFFVIPLLRKMLSKEREQGFKVINSVEFNKKHSLRHFLKARLFINNGVASSEISNHQESFKIHSLTTNDLWAIAHEDEHSVAAGALITVVPIYANFAK